MMQSLFRMLVLVTVALAAPGALAAVAVDSVNYPAWVKRGTQLEALAPGARLFAGDEISTGASGRVWLAFDDGSVVKLGRNARFVIRRAGFQETNTASVLDAAFDVLVGAFRFTSGFFTPKRNAGHRVDFRVGAITAGIRGTDVWGRSAEDEDFVALLEGSIEVSAEGTAAQRMDQPLTLFAKKRGLDAGPVQTVDQATVAQLAPETELDPAIGIANTGGIFALVLMSLQTETLINDNLVRFEQAGYPVEARSVDINGQTYTRILLTGLADQRAAENLRDQIASRFGLEGVWITSTR